MTDTPPCDSSTVIADYLVATEAVRHNLDVGAVERLMGHLRRARDSGSIVFVAGNGGSAATGSHLVNDLGKAASGRGTSRLRAVSLSDNVSWLTALANDEGYERGFAGQLEALGRPADLLIVISASGNSPNLIAAVRSAHLLHMTTCAFLGFDGGALKRLVDDYLWVPTQKGAYGVVEDAHLMVCHILTECLRRDAVAPIPEQPAIDHERCSTT